MGEVRGKVALVTGSGVRVGREIALGLASAGAHLLVHYHRSAEGARQTVEEARRLGVQAFPCPADLADADAVQRLVETARTHFGSVDILVHSASPFLRGSLAEVTLSSWRQVMGVVVEGFLLLVQGLAPGMIERGDSCIVAILDRGAFEPWPSFLAHATAKSALWALTRSLAVALAPQVRVNAVVPGPVLPPEGYTPQQVEQRARGTLLGRWGTPRDIVEAVLFLIRADFITGEALFVDGGERWVHRRLSTSARAPGISDGG